MVKDALVRTLKTKESAMKRNVLLVVMYVVGCSGKVTKFTADATVREPLVQLPYVRDSAHVCTQGEESAHEHADGSERHDVDLAAQNPGEDVVAPASGVAYLHGGAKFGTHVNIDLGNGTYVVIAFMKNVTIADMQQVAVGQVIGQAGSVHGGVAGVHLGLHRGDANVAASGGTSIEMARLLTRDRSLPGGFEELAGVSLVCGAGSDPLAGHTYESATATVLRHLPGTLVKTAASAKVYRVNADGTRSWITNEMTFRASGFTDAMIVPVSEIEMSCYGTGAFIDVPLPAPSGFQTRDGSLRKVAGKPTVYVVSNGVAWPVKLWEVFVIAGYDPANVVEVTVTGFAAQVTAVGDCVSGENCLDLEYLGACARMPAPPVFPPDAGTPDGDPPDVPPVPDASAPSPDAALIDTAPPPDVSVVDAKTSAPDFALSVVPDAGTPVFDAGALAVDSSVKDFSWVYRDEGSALCLNGRYFYGSPAELGGDARAVLLIWSGPGTDGTKGPVSSRTGDRFCWNFSDKPPGIYRFWADAADPTCTGAVCPHDTDDKSGALYYDAPAVTGMARKWLYCKDTGCDGMGYWDGSSWTPAGS
jgi:hypothetical protein